MKKTQTEETYQTQGNKLIELIKKLLRQGTIRRVTVKNAKGAIVFDFPVVWGVVAALISAPLTLLAGIVVLSQEYTITIVRSKKNN